MKIKVGLEQKEDGVFFIAFEDYLNFFYNTSICKYGCKGKRSVVIDEHNIEDVSLIKFTIKKNYDTPVDLSSN